MRLCVRLILCLALLIFAVASVAAVDVNFKDTKTGKSLGTVNFSTSRYGVLIKPNLQGLTPGAHGFHVHAVADCSEGGKAAGGHFDPLETGKHLGPFDDSGHLGDLPALCADKNGLAQRPILAPRIILKDIRGLAVIIHGGADNYSDQPEKLGGGGSRVACAIIPHGKKPAKHA